MTGAGCRAQGAGRGGEGGACGEQGVLQEREAALVGAGYRAGWRQRRGWGADGRQGRCGPADGVRNAAAAI